MNKRKPRLSLPHRWCCYARKPRIGLSQTFRQKRQTLV